MKKVIIIDNYDSFVYNLVHAVEEILDQDITIKKSDKITLDEIENYDYIILSPGPGLPDEAGLLKEVIKKYGPSKKILGVCLGLQAIGEVYGCELQNLKQVYHGIQSEIQVTDKSSAIYKGLPATIEAGRYHSWVIEEKSLTDDLKVTSRAADGEIMSIEHIDHQVYAVQYHPESIMTPEGKKILANFLAL